ncbi:hypothetical protein Q1695_009088 [Nippostrongylus brasiliensis]|nr:hypothetical protein Q1695_009088 [Nippostrongylus brasiliensis]
MSSGVSSGQATCEVCEKVMLCRNVSSHLKKMHNYTTEQAEEVKKTLKMETMIEGLIICPIYDDQFLNKEGFAGHCLLNHSDDGADGEKQDYTVYHINVESEETSELNLQKQVVKDSKDLLRIRQLQEFQDKFAEIIAFLEVHRQKEMLEYLKTN